MSDLVDRRVFYGTLALAAVLAFILLGHAFRRWASRRHDRPAVQSLQQAPPSAQPGSGLEPPAAFRPGKPKAAAEPPSAIPLPRIIYPAKPKSKKKA